MGSASDALRGQPSSLTARRSAASNLPNFQLPPPELPNMSKYPAYTALSATQSSPVNVGNLLTPPSNLPGDGMSSMPSGMHSGGSGSSSSGVPPYPPVGYWQAPAPSGSPYGMTSGPPNPSAFPAQGMPPGSMFPITRSVFSPSLGSLVRNSSNSPTAGEGLSLPPPPFDLSLPPFPSAMPMSAPSNTNLPNLAVAQQQALAASFMATPTTSSVTQPSPVHAPEPYNSQRLPPTPSYYGSQPSSAQQATFPATYTAPSPSQSSPASRISPISAQSAQQSNGIMQQSQGPPTQYSRPYNNYTLPAMSGPVMSNLHSPGSQMALVGGMPSGMMGSYANHAQVSHMYVAPQTHAQQQPQDRPFKCDQCPQSFNRNHDLKRHKRIHLAVKPFPCGHCDKSFSRKDALKRHILVKGCGKPSDGVDGSNSPPDRSEITSSDGDEHSPSMHNANVKGES